MTARNLKRQQQRSRRNQTFQSEPWVPLEILLLRCTDLAGFEPAICSLGDCRPIQARLQAQTRNTVREVSLVDS